MTYTGRGIIDKKRLNTIRQHLLPPLVLFLLISIYLVFAGILLSCIYSKSLSITCIILGTACLFLYKYSVTTVVTQRINTLNLLLHQDQVEFKVDFFEDHVHFTLFTETEIFVDIPYSEFKKIITIPNYYVLITKIKNAFFIYQNSFNDASSFMCFFKTHMKQYCN